MLQVWRVIISFTDESPCSENNPEENTVDVNYAHSQFIKTKRRSFKFIVVVKVMRNNRIEPIFEKCITTGFQLNKKKEEAISDNAWYYKGAGQIPNWKEALFSSEKQRYKWPPWGTPLVLGPVLIVALGIGMHLRQHMAKAVSQINNTTILTTPIPGREFTVRIEGSGFNPDIIQVVVTGPGCRKFGPCTVSNNVLQNYGSVTNNLIERIPLTLAAGDYHIYVQNGTGGQASNGWPLTIKPGETPEPSRACYELSGCQISRKMQKKQITANLEVAVSLAQKRNGQYRPNTQLFSFKVHNTL